MASDGTGASWSNSIPLDSANVADVPVEIRDLRAGTKLRADKEHIAYANSSAGGEHKQGAAVSYHQNSAPTLRPDGVTTLSAADKGRLWLKATDNSLWIWDSTAWQHSTITALAAIADGLITKVKLAEGIVNGIYPTAVYTDQKVDTTDGGTFTSGSWRTRTLNTEQSDNGNFASIAANQINLQSGTYRIVASAPAQQVGFHQIRFRDVTNGATVAYGTSECAPNGTIIVTRSFILAEFTVVDDDTLFELQHQCLTTHSGSGLGLAVSMGGVEIYSQVQLFKLL